MLFSSGWTAKKHLSYNKNYILFVCISLFLLVEDLRFEKEANSEHVAKGGKAVFACRPFPTQFGPHLIQWRRNGVTLKNGGRYKVGDGSLTINDVRSDDCGEYYCVAKDENSIITSVGRLSIVDGKYDCPNFCVDN